MNELKQGYSADNFQRVFATLSERWPASSAELMPKRRHAMDKLIRNGLPSRQVEEWKYTNLKKLTNTDYQLASPSEALRVEVQMPSYIQESDIALVFVNGHYRADLSQNTSTINDVMRCVPLHLGWSDQKLDLADKIFDERYSQSSLEALNTAFAYDGIFIHVPRKFRMELPIHILHIVDGNEQPMAIFPVVHINLDPLSSLRVIESFVGRADHSYFVNASTRVELQDGAHLHHLRMVEEGEQASHIGTVHVDLAKDAKFDHFSYAQSGALIRQSVMVHLLGEGAESRLHGLYLADDQQHSDQYTSVEHVVPHTSSQQVYKGVLSGQSRGVFMGRVKVHPGAQQTVALQQNKNLLLSDQAEADTRPQLEIDADDVKCSHGATIGQLAEEEIFYLLSRGISRERALQMLCEGFAQGVFSGFEDDQSVRIVSERARTFFAGGKFGL